MPAKQCPIRDHPCNPWENPLLQLISITAASISYKQLDLKVDKFQPARYVFLDDGFCVYGDPSCFTFYL